MNVCGRIFVVHFGSRVDDEVLYLKTIARILTAALLLSYGIRRDTCVCIDREPRSILVVGSKVRRLYADEASSYGWVKHVLKTMNRSLGIELVESCNDLCKQRVKLVDVLNRSVSRDLVHAVTCIDVDIVVRDGLVYVEGLEMEPWTAVVIANIILDTLRIFGQCS